MLEEIFGEIRLVQAGEELYAEFESPLQRLCSPPEARF